LGFRDICFCDEEKKDFPYQWFFGIYGKGKFFEKCHIRKRSKHLFSLSMVKESPEKNKAGAFVTYCSRLIY
jgi:hypothetical protein